MHASIRLSSIPDPCSTPGHGPSAVASVPAEQGVAAGRDRVLPGHDVPPDGPDAAGPAPAPSGDASTPRRSGTPVTSDTGDPTPPPAGVGAGGGSRQVMNLLEAVDRRRDALE